MNSDINILKMSVQLQAKGFSGSHVYLILNYCCIY